jgi:hypothetical protein
MQVHATSFPFLTGLLLCCGIGLAVILLLPAHRQREIKLVSAISAG